MKPTQLLILIIHDTMLFPYLPHLRLEMQSNVFPYFLSTPTLPNRFNIMTGRCISHFGLNSFGEIFSYFATSWKLYCLTFWIGKKSRFFRRFFQYCVICHFSKYIRLALTDFNKNKVFCRKCMWLQLRQVLKKFTEGNARKFTVSFACFAHVNVINIEKHWCFPMRARRLLELSSLARVQS